MPHIKSLSFAFSLLICFFPHVSRGSTPEVNQTVTTVVEYFEPLPPAIQSTAKDSNPKSDYIYRESQIVQSGQYVWSRFEYETTSAENKWPYGSTFVLWNKASMLPIWSLDWRGDFQPHSIAWIDFDGDGQLDLRLLAGEEEEYSTFIYLWRVKGDQFGSDSMKKVYQTMNDYSVILDIDHDGRPEILDSGHSVQTRPKLMCSQEGRELLIPRKLRAEIAREYHRGVGKFNYFNFGLPGSDEAWSLKLFDPFNIYSLADGQLNNVTSKYPKHIKWRLSVLRQIRKANPVACAHQLDELIAYNQRQLKQSVSAFKIRP